MRRLLVFVVVAGLLASVAPKVVLAHDPQTITKDVYEDRVVPVYEDFWKETVRVPNYTPGSLSFRMAARKTANSRVELALQERIAVALIVSWGDRQYPVTRFFPLSTATGKWLHSAPISFGNATVRIAARKTANSRVEIALQPRVGNTWGAYKYPSKRFFPLSTAIGKWLYTSTVTVGFTETTYRTETRYRKVTDPPPNNYTVISKQKVRRQTGTTTIQEKTGTTTVTTHTPHNNCPSGSTHARNKNSLPATSSSSTMFGYGLWIDDNDNLYRSRIEIYEAYKKRWDQGLEAFPVYPVQWVKYDEHHPNCYKYGPILPSHSSGGGINWGGLFKKIYDAGSDIVRSGVNLGQNAVNHLGNLSRDGLNALAGISSQQWEDVRNLMSYIRSTDEHWYNSGPYYYYTCEYFGITKLGTGGVFLTGIAIFNSLNNYLISKGLPAIVNTARLVSLFSKITPLGAIASTIFTAYCFLFPPTWRPGMPLPPKPPSNITSRCSAGNRTLTVSWRAASNASYYTVRLFTSVEGKNTWETKHVEGGSTTSTTFPIIPGKNYTVDMYSMRRVTINNVQGLMGAGPVKMPGSITCAVPVPPPSNVSVSCSADGRTLTVSWDAVVGATSYEFKVVGRSAETVDAPATSGTLVVSPGRAYTAQVRSAVTSGGNSRYSGWVSQSDVTKCADNRPMVVPSNVSIRCYAGGVKGRAGVVSVIVNWDADSTGRTERYEVESNASLGNRLSKIVIGANTATFIRTENGRYSFKVRGYSSKSGVGWSGWSSYGPVKTCNAPTASPLGVPSVSHVDCVSSNRPGTVNVTVRWLSGDLRTRSFAVRDVLGSGLSRTGLTGTTAVFPRTVKGTYQFEVQARASGIPSSVWSSRSTRITCTPPATTTPSPTATPTPTPTATPTPAPTATPTATPKTVSVPANVRASCATPSRNPNNPRTAVINVVVEWDADPTGITTSYSVRDNNRTPGMTKRVTNTSAVFEQTANGTYQFIVAGYSDSLKKWSHWSSQYNSNARVACNVPTPTPTATPAPTVVPARLGVPSVYRVDCVSSSRPGTVNVLVEWRSGDSRTRSYAVRDVLGSGLSRTGLTGTSVSFPRTVRSTYQFEVQARASGIPSSEWSSKSIRFTCSPPG